jgi:hypothetical protein
MDALNIFAAIICTSQAQNDPKFPSVKVKEQKQLRVNLQETSANVPSGDAVRTPLFPGFVCSMQLGRWHSIDLDYLIHRMALPNPG